MTRARWSCGADGRRTVWTATRDKCVCGGYSFPHRATGGAVQSLPYFKDIA